MRQKSNMNKEGTMVAVDGYLMDPAAFDEELQARGQEGVGRYGRHKIGDWVLIRTYTFGFVGKIEYIDHRVIGFAQSTACWYNESGAWETALDRGQLLSVELYPNNAFVDLSIEAIVECVTFMPGKSESEKKAWAAGGFKNGGES